MVRWIRAVWAFTLVLWSTVSFAEVTDIEASVDKNPVIANESFVLTVTFNDDVSSSAFEPQQLLSDFIVGRTSVSRQTSIMNGELSKLARFTTVLIAEEPGNYTIPAIMMDGVQSQAITIEVLAAGSDTSARSDKIAFIESTMDSQSVFLQQPLTYIVRLYLAADLNKGNLVPPQMENADIRQVGSDEESSEMINGRRYKIYQRTFQITPNQSGRFDIKGARFDGEVYAEGQRSIFSSFSNTQPVSTVGQSTELTVKPIPSNWQGPWLPSELVTLSQSLSPDTDSLQVGEPLTISYQLTAVGVKPEQLPDISPQFPDSVRVYPDNSETDQYVRNGVTIAQKTVSVAVVPNQPGQLQLPAVEVPWFNTKRGQRDVAKTQPLQLTVEGVANTMAQQPDPAPSPASDVEPETSPQSPTQPVKPDTAFADHRLLVLLAVLLGLSLLGNIAFFWRRKQQSQSVEMKSPTVEKPLTSSQQWRNFQKACADNDARNADVFIRKWAQQRFDKRLVSLGDLARWLADGDAVDKNLQQQLNALQQSMFGPDKPRWTGGKALYQSLRKALDRQPKADKKGDLPELYRA